MVLSGGAELGGDVSEDQEEQSSEDQEEQSAEDQQEQSSEDQEEQSSEDQEEQSSEDDTHCDSELDEMGKSDFSAESEDEQDTAAVHESDNARADTIAALAALPPIQREDVNFASAMMLGGKVVVSKTRLDARAQQVAKKNLARLKGSVLWSQDCVVTNRSRQQLVRMISDVVFDVALIAKFAARSVDLQLHRLPFGQPREMREEDEEDLACFRTDIFRLYERSTREAGSW